MRKPPCENRTQNLLVPKFYLTPNMPLSYKAMETSTLLCVYKPLTLLIYFTIT
ncbi:hypothetical protein Hanom_Chr10g00889291 [Helianthus anomalus]